MGTRITNLPVATTVNPADVLPIVQSGTTKQAASSLIKTTNASELTSGTVAVARLPIGTTSNAGVLQIGSASGTACEGNDARLSNSRTPTGAAGGDLTGTYPNPTIAPLSPSPAGTFGSSTVIPQITVNSKGQVTSVSGVAPQGTVSSVNVSGGTTGLTFSGGPVTGAGTLTAAGTLSIPNGGTGANTQQAALNSLAGSTTSGRYLRGDGANVTMSQIQAIDIPTLNQNTTGTASNVTGIVALVNGGTGSNTAAGARTNLGLVASATTDTTNAVNITSGILNASRLPAFTGDITTPQGSTVTTLSNTGVAAGTVGSSTQIPVITADAKGRITALTTAALPGLAVSGVTAGTYGSSAQIPALTVDQFGRITSATNVAAVPAGITALTGDVTASGSGSQPATLAASGVTAGTYGSASSVAQLVVDSKGRITSATNVGISGSAGGTVTSVGVTSNTLSITSSPVVFNGNIGVELPASGVTPGTVGSSAQIPVITADAQGRITALSTAAISALTPTGVTAGTYGSTASIPVLTVNSFGQLTSASTAAISALTPTGVTAGTYGSANSVGSFAVNSLGQLTGATSSLIAITSAQITGILATSQIPAITSAQIAGVLATSQIPIISSTRISGLAASATVNTTNASNITTGTLPSAQLPTSGVTPGTYGNAALIPVFTVDSIGRLTSVSTVGISPGGIPTAVGYLRETITTSATAATGTINFDVLTQPTLYYTSNATGSFTLNIRGDSTTTLDSLLTTAQSMTLTFLNTNGGTPYGVIAVNVDGTARAVKWLNGTGSIPPANASVVDAWTLTIIKTAANTFTVLGSLSKFV